jgi:DNA-binding MurR/RpiR family transcriptional regulator
MSNMDEIAHALAALINAVIKLELKEENEDNSIHSATRILKANMEWMKEVTKYEVSELKEILQTMSNQQHERAVDFLCQRMGIYGYGFIKEHPDRSCWKSNHKW